MERQALLIARIALYRRYLAEGASGDVALAYLWQIRQDEAAMAIIAKERDNERRDAGATDGIPPAQSKTVSDDGWQDGRS